MRIVPSFFFDIFNTLMGILILVLTSCTLSYFTSFYISLHQSFNIYFTFLVAKLLYKSKCTSVSQPPLGGNVIFWAPNLDRGLISSSFATYGCCHPCLFFIYLSFNKISFGILQKIFCEKKTFLCNEKEFFCREGKYNDGKGKLKSFLFPIFSKYIFRIYQLRFKRFFIWWNSRVFFSTDERVKGVLKEKGRDMDKDYSEKFTFLFIIIDFDTFYILIFILLVLSHFISRPTKYQPSLLFKFFWIIKIFLILLNQK